MRSDRNLLGLSIMFFVLAVALALLFWSDVSLAAKIGMFALGFGSGIMAGQMIVQRSTKIG